MATTSDPVRVVVPWDGAVGEVAATLHDYLAHPRVTTVLVVVDGTAGSDPSDAEAALAGVDDPRLEVVALPRVVGEGVAWKLAINHAGDDPVPPTRGDTITVIHGAGASSESDELDALLAPLDDADADVVLGVTRATGLEGPVGSFRSVLAERLATTAVSVVTNLRLRDLLGSTVAAHTTTLAQLELSQDGAAIRSELMACAALPHRPTGTALRVSEVGLRATSAAPTTSASSWRRVRSGLWGAVRHTATGRRLAGWRATTPDPDVDADSNLSRVLEDLSTMHGYAAWIVESLDDALASSTASHPILEVGAGHGAITTLLAERGRVVAYDPSPAATEALHQAFDGHPTVEVVGALDEAVDAGPYGAAVLVNVLEHVEDEVGLLRRLGDVLAPDGVIAVFAPAHPELYSTFDRLVGHHRRYRLGDLAVAVHAAGLEVVDLRYVNAVGALGWFVNARFVGATRPSATLTRLYERVVLALTRATERRAPSFGQSVVCVARSRQ